MKAVIFNNYGSVEDLRFEEIATPVAGADKVLVKIHATAVNHIDIAIAAGAMKNIFPLKFSRRLKGFRG